MKKIFIVIHSEYTTTYEDRNDTFGKTVMRFRDLDFICADMKQAINYVHAQITNRDKDKWIINLCAAFNDPYIEAKKETKSALLSETEFYTIEEEELYESTDGLIYDED